jgi:hypothetical protein
MLHHPLDSVNTFLDDIYRNGKRPKGPGRFGGAAGAVLQLSANAWLQYRYGIKPLLNDVKNAMKLLRRDYSQADKPVRVRRFANAGATATSSGTALVYDGWLEVTDHRQSSSEYLIKATYWDEVIPNRWHDLGLNPANVVGLAWELLPYSFVVDWFTNIGDVIYANAPRVGIKPLGGSLMIEKTHKFTSQAVSSRGTNASWILTGGPSDSYTIEKVEKERSSLSLESKLVVRNDFRLDNWVRALDAAALTKSLLSRLRW